MEEHVTISCGGIMLEGLFSRLEGEKGVVIAHPHPLYGGDMYNPVVTAIKNAYMGVGYSTLRFNFRGVGDSRGTHDNGIGEQSDVLAGIDFLKTKGIRNIDLAGYSFGAWVIAGLFPEPGGISRVLLVSLPVAMMDISDVHHPNLPIRMITGERDDIAPPDKIEALLGTLGERAGLSIIPDADHFFSGTMRELESAVWDAIR